MVVWCWGRTTKPAGTSTARLDRRTAHPPPKKKQDETSPIETSLAAFQRQFAKQDQFRLGCGLCILLQDQLLTRAQVCMCACACPLSVVWRSMSTYITYKMNHANLTHCDDNKSGWWPSPSSRTCTRARPCMPRRAPPWRTPSSPSSSRPSSRWASLAWANSTSTPRYLRSGCSSRSCSSTRRPRARYEVWLEDDDDDARTYTHIHGRGLTCGRTELDPIISSDSN